MLLANPPAELPNADLYTGYNEYDPLLDSKVIAMNILSPIKCFCLPA